MMGLQEVVTWCHLERGSSLETHLLEAQVLGVVGNLCEVNVSCRVFGICISVIACYSFYSECTVAYNVCIV